MIQTSIKYYIFLDVLSMGLAAHADTDACPSGPESRYSSQTGAEEVSSMEQTRPILVLGSPNATQSGIAAKALTPESRGLDAMAGGFQQMGLSDHEKLEREFPVYDALYVYCGGTLPLPQPALQEVTR